MVLGDNFKVAEPTKQVLWVNGKEQNKPAAQAADADPSR